MAFVLADTGLISWKLRQYGGKLLGAYTGLVTRRITTCQEAKAHRDFAEEATVQISARRDQRGKLSLTKHSCDKLCKDTEAMSCRSSGTLDMLKASTLGQSSMLKLFRYLTHKIPARATLATGLYLVAIICLSHRTRRVR